MTPIHAQVILPCQSIFTRPGASFYKPSAFFHFALTVTSKVPLRRVSDMNHCVGIWGCGLLLVNNDSVQVAQAKVLLLRDHRSIEGLSKFLGSNAGTTLDLHLSESGLGLAEGAAAFSLGAGKALQDWIFGAGLNLNGVAVAVGLLQQVLFFKHVSMCC